MKLTCKIEQERGDEFEINAELSMYNVHTVDDMQEFMDALQRIAGFHGVIAKLIHTNREE